jgi:sulfotransferase
VDLELWLLLIGLGKMILLLSGLTRSGSSLLCAILRQNPNITAKGRSGLLPILYGTINAFNSDSEKFLLANDINPNLKKDTVNFIASNYHNDKTQHSVDKSAFWTHPANFEMTQYFNSSKKIVVLIRDIKEIFQSWVYLYKKQTNEKKIDSLIIENPNIIDLPLLSITKAIDSGLRDQLVFINYDELIHNPLRSLDSIYDGWGIERFSHDLNNIDTTKVEKDEFYGIQLHEVRKKIKKRNNLATLSKEAELYCLEKNEILRSYGLLNNLERLAG